VAHSVFLRREHYWCLAEARFAVSISIIMVPVQRPCFAKGSSSEVRLDPFSPTDDLTETDGLNNHNDTLMIKTRDIAE
jgi:hypothetical protein